MCILLEYPSIEDYPVYDPPKISCDQIFILADDVLIDAQSKFQLDQCYQFGQEVHKKMQELKNPKADRFRLK